MELTEALQFEALRKAHLVAGAGGLHRDVRWVHVVDLPDPAAWVRPGMLLLTTGYAWPRAEAPLRELTRALAARQIAAVGLAVPQFFEHFPAAMRDEAERANLPLLEIPWEVPFAQIAEELLQALVVDQYRQIEQSEAIHRALTRAAVEAESLQDLATALGSLINRAVTIEDAEGRLLAAHRDPALEDELRRATVELGRTPAAYAEALAEMGLGHELEVGAGPVRIPPVPAMGATGRVLCPIYLKRELVGRAWIIEGARPLSEIDLRAAEQAATIAALHILHQRELEVREARVGYAFLDSLLASDFALTPQIAERARLLGFEPAGCYRVGLLVLHGALPMAAEGFQRRERLASRLREELLALGAPALVALSANQVPFLLTDVADPAILWAALAGPDVSLTLSRAYVGVEGVRQGYREVQSLAPLARPGELQRAELLLLPRLLAGDTAARAEFLEELLGPLRRARQGEDLVSSLITYARHGFRLARAAEALFIHPKTLAYRLGRIAGLTGLDLDDAETRFRIQLAAQILALGE
jgi:purine catabolism regulator